MRPEPNNDIDLLLRQLSGRNGVPVSEIDEQHLDADELNSYVAKALPAPARARYMEHLADCSSCRKLVAQLSAAQGPVTAPLPVSAVAPSGLKSFLASLFSPMVLRYAVPALGLIVIAALGIFVLRPQQEAGTVAQLSNEAPATAPIPRQEAPASSSPQAFADGLTNTSANKQASESEAVGPVAKDAGRAKASDDQTDLPGDAAGASAGAQPPAAKVAAPVVQNEPPPATADSAKAKKEQAETVAVQATPNEPIKRDYNSGESVDATVTPGQTTRRDVQVRAAQRGVTPMAGGGVAKAPAESKTESKAESKVESREAEVAAETRSVAGRSFRKSAGVWIDTAYDSAKPITAVARGSEQYRALVADEPSIKTIADELDGQIVVVWKGRTYRIR
jgi:hypothetical protein